MSALRNISKPSSSLFFLVSDEDADKQPARLPCATWRSKVVGTPGRPYKNLFRYLQPSERSQNTGEEMKFVYKGIEYGSAEQFWEFRSMMAERFEKETAEMHAAITELDKTPIGGQALALTIMLMTDLKAQKQTPKYSMEQCARRVLHVLRLSDDPAEGMVLMSHLLMSRGPELSKIFDELLEKTRHQDWDDLPEDMVVAIAKLKATEA
jgi:hypothetical protein